MMEDNESLKIKKGSKIDGIIEIFERESPKVRMLAKLKVLIIVSVVLLIIYLMVSLGIIIEILSKHIVLDTFFENSVVIILPFAMIISIYKIAEKITYKFSKQLGGKKSECCFNINKVIESIIYNVNIMRNEEWKLINKILKVNRLDNINAVKEIRDCIDNKQREVYNTKDNLKSLLTALVIEAISIIISVYTFIYSNENIEQKISIMKYIVIGIFMISTITIIIYIFYNLKKYFFTNYTSNRLTRFLTDLLLNKYRYRVKECKFKSYQYNKMLNKSLRE